MEEVTHFVAGPITLVYLAMLRQAMGCINADHVVIDNRPISPGQVRLISSWGRAMIGGKRTGVDLTFEIHFLMSVPVYRSVPFIPLLYPESPTPPVA